MKPGFFEEPAYRREAETLNEDQLHVERVKRTVRAFPQRPRVLGVESSLLTTEVTPVVFSGGRCFPARAVVVRTDDGATWGFVPLHNQPDGGRDEVYRPTGAEEDPTLATNRAVPAEHAAEMERLLDDAHAAAGPGIRAVREKGPPLTPWRRPPPKRPTTKTTFDPEAPYGRDLGGAPLAPPLHATLPPEDYYGGPVEPEVRRPDRFERVIVALLFVGLYVLWLAGFVVLGGFVLEAAAIGAGLATWALRPLVRFYVGRKD